MKKVYRGLALLIALGVVLQAAAIAYAWFEVLGAIDDGAVLNEDYDGNGGHMAHGIVGMTVMPLLALLLLAVSPFTKLRGATTWAGLVLLATVAQVVLAFVSFGAAAVGVLHGVNAFVLLGVALATARRVTSAEPAQATASVPAQAGASQPTSPV